MTCDKLICIDKKPEEPWKLFFGDNGNFLRIDRCDYPIFQKLYEKAFSDFWTHKVVDFSKDIIGWENIDEVGRRMFLLNNGYQALMDSGVTSLFSYLAMVATNTELEILYKYNDQNESIHALSYSYGLSQMFGGQAEEKLDIVYKDDFIKRRLNNEIDISSEFVEYVIYGKNKDDKAKYLLLKEILSAYFLESIKFPFSFLVTWRINEGYGNAIQGFAQLLKLIAHDELTTHTVTHQNVWAILKKEERQGFHNVFDEAIEFAYEYVKKISEEEIKWAEYLFKEGNIPNFTIDMAKHFVRYYSDRSLRLLKLKPIYNEPKSELIEWYDRYRDINLMNSALQEVSNVAYQKGVTKNDLDKLDDLKIEIKW